MLGKSTLNPTGHLEIWKVDQEGNKELYWSDHNVITSGMGVGLAHFHSGFGSPSILDYQIRYFQVGNPVNSTEYDSSQNDLESPLAKKDYGKITATSPVEIEWADVDELYLRKKANQVTTTKQAFAKIRHSNTHRVNKNAVRFTIPLNERNCNGKDLSEIGMFMKNILNDDEDTPSLVAYRQFPKIKKTEFFTLVFLWTIQF
jgi:hypothetical protein